MLGLKAQQPWTAMKVHQWTVKTSFNEKSFQVIEEYGSIRPSVSSFSSPQSFPLLTQIIVTIKNILLGDLTLTRAEGAMDTNTEGIYSSGCEQIHIDNVRVLDNRGGRAAVFLKDSRHIRIERCEVVNYMYICVDDRVDHPLYGFAFRCINGAGITVRGCQVVQILNNRVIENNIKPTRKMLERYDLGKVIKRSDKPGRFAPEGGFHTGWRQGSAIEVHDALKSSHALLEGNYIENAAQGFDVHADMVIITNNHVNTCYTGIKTMHGGRHVMVTNNIVERADDEGIYMGSNNAFRARPGKDGKPPTPANANNGCIVANNIISEMGYGLGQWAFWKPKVKSDSPLAIKIKGISFEGEMTRDELIITGNIVSITAARME